MTNPRTVTLHSRFRAVGTLPVVCAVLVALNGLYVLLVAFGNMLWIGERDTARPTARSASTIGLLMILVLFFGGFIVVGGEWFQMWRSTAWNGLDPAFRNCVLALVTLVLLHLPTPRAEAA
jgi:predicted small integral membrane protein